MTFKQITPRTVNTYLNYSHFDVNSTPHDLDRTGHTWRNYLHMEDTPDRDQHKVAIRSIRGNEDLFTLSAAGFQLSRMTPPEINYGDDAQVKEHYYPAVVELMKSMSGAKEVVIFDHHVRNTTLENAISRPPDGEVDIRGPARFVHIDQTPTSARQDLVTLGSKALAETYKDRPFGIFNAWRPLRRIQCDPLGLCDARTIKEADKQEAGYPIPPHGESKNYVLKYSEEHEWWFVDEMDVNEIVVFRIFDSRVYENEDGGGVAHSAFVDPLWADKNMEPRSSIEVRAFVFW